MTIELLSLDDLPPSLGPQAHVLVAVPGSNGALKYKAAFSFVFEQQIPAATWTIAHGLNRYPQVTVVDTSGRLLDADVTYVDEHQVLITGDIVFAGTAYLA